MVHLVQHLVDGLQVEVRVVKKAALELRSLVVQVVVVAIMVC
jgi:hypothetical protein